MLSTVGAESAPDTASGRHVGSDRRRRSIRPSREFVEVSIVCCICSRLLLARSVGSLPRSDMSGVGGEADMPRQPNRRD